MPSQPHTGLEAAEHEVGTVAQVPAGLGWVQVPVGSWQYAPCSHAAALVPPQGHGPTACTEVPATCAAHRLA